jgi:opacity protein-like surface antigen
MSKSLVKNSLLAFGLLTSTLAFADQNHGAYITGGLGYGTIEGTDFDGGDLGRPAGKVGIGYQFCRPFALEANVQYYFDATSSSRRYDFTSNAVVGNVLGVLRAPITDNVYLVAKAGPGYTNIHGDIAGRWADYNSDFNNFSATYGAGIEFAASNHVSILFEYLGTTMFNDEEYASSTTQLNSVMGNLIFRF